MAEVACCSKPLLTPAEHAVSRDYSVDQISSCWGGVEALPSVLCPHDRGGNYKAIVEQVRGASAEARLYVLIHNIDGPGEQAITLNAG